MHPKKINCAAVRGVENRIGVSVGGMKADPREKVGCVSDMLYAYVCWPKWVMHYLVISWVFCCDFFVYSTGVYQNIRDGRYAKFLNLWNLFYASINATSVLEIIMQITTNASKITR